MNKRRKQPPADPTSVILTMRDGTTDERVFATRFQAELFLYQLPYLMTTQPDGNEVAGAILSPLEIMPEHEHRRIGLDFCEG